MEKKFLKTEEVIKYYCDECGKEITDYHYKGTECIVCGNDVCCVCGTEYTIMESLKHDCWCGYETDKKNIVICDKHKDLVDINAYENKAREMIKKFNIEPEDYFNKSLLVRKLIQ